MTAPVKLAFWNVVLGLAILCAALAGCTPRFYSAAPITARVVDAETRESIEGVIVIAEWQLHAGHGSPGPLMLLETVSDHAGTFHFPKWGPKRARIGCLATEDPNIFLFKDGYTFTVAPNPFRVTGCKLFGTVTSIYDGTARDIEMHKFDGSLKDWARHLEWFKGSLEIATAGLGQCEWKKIPRLIIALGKEREKLNAAGIGVGNYYDELVGSEEIQEREGCGSVRQFIQEHSQ